MGAAVTTICGYTIDPQGIDVQQRCYEVGNCSKTYLKVATCEISCSSCDNGCETVFYYVSHIGLRKYAISTYNDADCRIPSTEISYVLSCGTCENSHDNFNQTLSYFTYYYDCDTFTWQQILWISVASISGCLFLCGSCVACCGAGIYQKKKSSY